MTKIKYDAWIIPLAAEFLAQLIFVFLHCMANNTIGTTESVRGSPIVPAVGNGMCITILVATFGPVCGAHVNPVVTVAFTLSGCLKPIMLPFYIIVQHLGAMAGAGLALVINGKATGTFGLGEGVSITQGLLCEIMLTIVLILAILMSAIDQKDSPIGPITIGFAVIVCILAGFPTSGGCMNPALSFGPAFASGKWKHYWIYWVGPLIGSFMAVMCHKLILANKRILFKEKISQSRESTPMEKLRKEEDANGSCQVDPERPLM